MRNVAIQTELVGADEVKLALRAAPKLANTFIRQVFAREGKRWRKTFKRSQLGGRPGINAPGMRKVRDKNVGSFVTGKFEELSVFFKLSRFLRWHTEGATLTKRGGGTATLPGRLKFRQTVDLHVPRIVPDVKAAALRAVEVSFAKHQKSANMKNLRSVL